ncbi:MAG: hypothetical protein FWF97_04745 [Alphaproteobacteria bacterium]|nr:hypothetical protein [Alphaproteobacteria bacterium]
MKFDKDGLYRTLTIFGLTFRFIHRTRVRQANLWLQRMDIRFPEAFARHLQKTGQAMDWENPVTLSEKILWLWKYYYSRLPLFYRLYNKETFKYWMQEKGMGEYVPKLLGAWDRPQDIDWDKLPNQFVLKLVKGARGKQVMLVRDKSKLNKRHAIRKMKKWDYYGAKPRIIAEELLQDNDSGGLTDYKLFCLNGKPQYMIVYSRTKGTTRVSEKTYNSYDTNWKETPYVVSVPSNPPRGNIPRPKHLDKMLALAKKLSAEFPMVRVDLYLIGDKIYVGELTFIPSGGKMLIEPMEYNKKLGDMLELPEKLPPLKNVCIKTLTLLT